MNSTRSRMETIRHYMPFLGRLLIAHIFLVAAALKLISFSATAAFMASNGVPAPSVLLAMSLPIEICGGIMILLGWKARLAALVLCGWLVIVTPLFHAFWGIDPSQVQNQMNHFLKNLSLAGALIFIAGVGAGPVSIDEGQAGRT